MDVRERIELLTRRIEQLASQQSLMSRQLIELINELEELKREGGVQQKPVKIVTYEDPIEAPKQHQAPRPLTAPPQPRPKQTQSSLEEFVGKNLASKVGILVTIIGIFIGARYAIEHDLVSPLMRIIAGYVCGLVLIGIAIFLKKKYEAYSAVLMGGGLAVLYFITYTAYGFYGLMPQAAAFILMLLFTIASVSAALIYDRVIIAHLGLVGAYSIPFLLSDNSGRYVILFSYMAIINAGILFISFWKNWKSLFYTAYAITWVVYGTWQFAYFTEVHLQMAFFFMGLYFVMFYGMFLAYQLVKKEHYGVQTVTVLLSNAFIFYGLGYNALSYTNADERMGMFTVINAAIHFVVSVLIKPRIVDKALYYLVFGLSIVFLTVAVPVQFDGNWVTLLWTAEAVLVFIIGRTQNVVAYEKLGAGLMLLGLVSLSEDWVNYGESFESAPNAVKPFANIIFVTGLSVMAAFATILWFARNKKYATAQADGGMFRGYFVHIAAILFLLVSWLVFYLEIQAYFSQVGTGSTQIDLMRQVAVLLYSMVFTSVVVAINRKWIKSSDLNTASLAATGLLCLVLIMAGLPALNDLATLQYNGGNGPLYFGSLTLAVRYVVAAVTIVLLLQGKDAVKSSGEKSSVAKGWDLLIHCTLLALLTAEYVRWARAGSNGNEYKLGLSILWSLYGLYLIIWGIYKKQKHLRLAAILLFIVTLVKLFVYDLNEAGTVTKTISFISLGVILLLVSYLYNRYKEVLFGKDE